MRKILFLVLSFFFVTVACFAQEPKILNYDKDAKTIKLEIEGKEHVFSVPSEEIAPAEIPAEVTLEEAQPEETPKQERKKFAKGPAPANVGARLWNIPTDNLLQRGGLAFDFAHRFSGRIADETANDIYGLDTYAFTGLGLYYGLTNFLELHAFRSSLTDALEAGLKFNLFKESAKWGQGAPFGLTISSGFQNDNIQNSVDFYVQPILTKVIIPRWLKVYFAPTWANRTGTIGRPDSKSASFFSFLDPKGRPVKREQGTFALPVGIAVGIIPNRLSFIGEYVPVTSGYREVKNAFSFGLQILSRLETHVWTIGISNTPYSTFGQFIVGGPNNDLHIGFNIAARIK